MQKIVLLTITIFVCISAFTQPKSIKLLQAINKQRESIYSFFTLLQEKKISDALQLVDDSVKNKSNNYGDTLEMHSTIIQHYLDSAKLVVRNLQVKDGYMIYKCTYETFNQALFLCYVKYEWSNESSLIKEIKSINDEELQQYNNRIYK